jgi:hypothetical protein
MYHKDLGYMVSGNPYERDMERYSWKAAWQVVELPDLVGDLQVACPETLRVIILPEAFLVHPALS